LSISPFITITYKSPRAIRVYTDLFASHFHFSPFPFFLLTLKRLLQTAKVLRIMVMGPDPSTARRVAVIGGGIAGLAAAHIYSGIVVRMLGKDKRVERKSDK